MDDETIIQPPTIEDNEAPHGRAFDGTPLDVNGNPAPHGLKKDGTAAKKRGRQSGSKGSTAPRKTKKASQPSYGEGLNQVVQLMAAVPYAVGIASGNDMLLADSWAVQNFGPGVADAIADMAETDERIAKVCDKITKSTPYAALTAAVIPMLMQIVVNHGAMAPGMMGTHDPKLIVAHMKESHYASQQSTNGESEQASQN